MNSTRQDLPGLVTFEHEFEVPLDHNDSAGAKITVFAREVVTPDTLGKDLPWLLFLQGGPGFPAGRPMGNSGWIERATTEFRVLLLDQRGTGRSTPVTHESLARFETPEAQAEYLAHFRSDSIVADAECIRKELAGVDAKWTLLGQSYGGFCSIQYLSQAPEGLEAALITGGVPGIDTCIEDIYKQTFAKMAEKNRAYYARYPRDVQRVHDIAAYIKEHDVRLPGGDRFTVERLQSLGGAHGMSDGYETLHYLLDEAFVEGPEGPQLGYAFLRGVENRTAFDTNPIYAILHEPIYSQGAATNWCAARMHGDFPEFAASASPLFFTAEMIYPWMFEQSAVLSNLAKAAEILAQKSDWSELYNLEVLAKNTVPVAAAVYHDDAYVPVALSLETAQRIPNLRTWITNEYEHNGLRADGGRLIGRLLDMTRGKA